MNVSYPFGYGLSYTNFEYGELSTAVENDTINVSFAVTNMGDLTGKEVVQVYAEKLNSSIDRPAQELKAFAKTGSLQAGAMDSIAIQIPVKELRYWDEAAKGWTLEKGAYNIKVGASSRDIRQVGEISL